MKEEAGKSKPKAYTTDCMVRYLKGKKSSQARSLTVPWLLVWVLSTLQATSKFMPQPPP